MANSYGSPADLQRVTIGIDREEAERTGNVDLYWLGRIWKETLDEARAEDAAEEEAIEMTLERFAEVPRCVGGGSASGRRGSRACHTAVGVAQCAGGTGRGAHPFGRPRTGSGIPLIGGAARKFAGLPNNST